MANVIFKKGVVANLPTEYSEGTVYITTDERAMYLDVDSSTRIRIGDFQEFATLEELQAHANPSATALYYVSDINCLAKWTGTAYIQINRDTGATSVEVTGDGNAVTDVSYDPTTRKLTVTKGKTYATPGDVDNKITEKVGVFEGTIKDYIDDKTSGIVSDTAISELNDRVGNVEKLVGTLPEDATAKNVVDYIAESIVALSTGDYAKAADLTAAVARIAANETAIAELKGTGDGSVSKQIADTVAAIVAGAPEDFDTLKEISDWISTHADSASAMNTQINENKTAIDSLKTLIGTLPESATSTNIVDYIAESIAALSSGDFAQAADLTAAVARITALEADSHTHSNKDVLDAITSANVTAWTAAEQNAKNYVDEKTAWGSF